MWHTFAPYELFVMSQQTEMVSHMKVCAIDGIRFNQMNYFRLGNTVEMVGQINVCVIDGIQFIRMNILR